MKEARKPLYMLKKFNLIDLVGRWIENLSYLLRLVPGPTAAALSNIDKLPLYSTIFKLFTFFIFFFATGDVEHFNDTSIRDGGICCRYLMNYSVLKCFYDDDAI